MTFLEGMVLFILIEHTCFNCYALFIRPRRDKKHWDEMIDRLARSHDGLGRVMAVATVSWKSLEKTIIENNKAHAARVEAGRDE